ncbi:hypothetical protein WAB17_08050 [Parerythrobacter aurantius]|uniref:hypothetical protein n=1 Tax=Parerythrobacter aurantius TaxID=3127706 RepID=UPI00324E6E23
MTGALQVRNEARLLCRHPLVGLALVSAAMMSGMLAAGSAAPVGSTPAEALLRANFFIPIFVLPFLAAAIGPVVFLREVEHDMRELVGSYPLTARQWLASRIGSCLALLLAACVMAQLAILAVLSGRNGQSLPQGMLESLGWLAVIHAPACLIWSCVLARLSSATGHPGVLYFGAGFGWVAYIGLASVTGTPLIAGSYVAWEPLRQALLVLDPYAITAMTSPIPESGLLRSRTADILAGRAVWLIACLLLLRGIAEMPSRVGRAGSGADAAAGRPMRAEGIGRLPRRTGLLLLHVRHVVRDRVFPLMIGGWILLLGSETFSGLAYAEPLAQVDPNSRDALNRVMWDVVPIAAALVLLYATDRICRMFPALRMHELVAATPYRSRAIVGSQVLAIWAVAILFLALAGLVVMAAQLAAHSPVEPREYALQFGLALLPLLMLGMMFVSIHALVRLRFAANLANLAVILFGFTSLAPALGLHHPLWRPLATPLVAPDHYWGFEGSIAGFAPFAAFWFAVALALLLMAVLLYHRGMAFRQVRWRSAIRAPLLGIALVIMAGAGMHGRAIHTALAAEGLLVTPEDRRAQRADYERTYSHWANVPQPDVASVRFAVDFDPESSSAALVARMTLVNRSDSTITQLLVGRNLLPLDGELRLSAGRAVRTDARLGQTVFRLDRPMQPGETRELVFAAMLHQSGLVPASMPLVLRPSFSSLPAHAMLPVIGYQRELTLRHPERRAEQGLPALQLTPPSRLPPQPATLASGSAHFESTITTALGQHAIGPGELVRSWQADGHRHFLYRSDGPMRSMPAFYSVPWRPKYAEAGPVTVEILAPKILAKDDPNLLGTLDALALLGSEVAPYPQRTFRLIAIPEIGPSGYALPQTALLSHRLAFRARPRADAGFSQAYRRAAHEAAHQWFGHRIGHGVPEEHAFLIESLAKYAELVVIERRFGSAALRALVAYELDRYRQARLDMAFPVAPLIDAEDNEDMYSRATLVFACLRQRVGDEPILTAIRQITDQGERSGRPARSLDFVDVLVATSGPEAEGAVRSLLLTNAPITDAFEKSGCELAG